MQKMLNISGKDTLCACNALTPYLYTQIFGKDFLSQVTGMRSFSGKKTEDMTEADIAEITKRSLTFGEIAFVFAKQAEIKEAAELVKLTKTDYFNWLSDKEPGTFTDARLMADLLALWSGNTTTTTESKN